MKIDINAPYDEDWLLAEQYIPSGSKVAIKKAAQERYGDPWGLTIAQFVALTQNDLSLLGDMSAPTIAQVYWLEAFKDFVLDFEHLLEGLKIPKDAQEMAAEDSMKKVSMAEGMLVFVRNYFGLQSFSDAEQMTLTDYIIARRDTFNQSIYNKRLAALRAHKYNRK